MNILCMHQLYFLLIIEEAKFLKLYFHVLKEESKKFIVLAEIFFENQLYCMTTHLKWFFEIGMLYRMIECSNIFAYSFAKRILCMFLYCFNYTNALKPSLYSIIERIHCKYWNLKQLWKWIQNMKNFEYFKFVDHKLQHDKTIQ